MKVAVLHTELAGYTLACLDALSQRCEEVHVVYWPVQDEAPFDLSRASSCQLYPRHQVDLTPWLRDLAPDVVLLSGWADRGYVKAVRNFQRSEEVGSRGSGDPSKSRAAIALCLDNHWKGSLRQRIGARIMRWRLRPALDWAWVPGAPQHEFARRLGFSTDRIRQGYYVADVDRFRGVAVGHVAGPRNRLIYIGRYIPVKGLNALWDAFEAFAADRPEWSLHCFGTGSEWAGRRLHPQIVHHGFVQPEDLRGHLSGAAAFVMPSEREPWGVVLHEMAAAGLPLLASDAVGAAGQFIEQGINGWTFKAGQVQEIKGCMERLAERAEDAGAWADMSERSVQLASGLTPSGWAEVVCGFGSKSGGDSSS